MAPKKNRIKVEQELQGESCPDGAPPPSKPGIGPDLASRANASPPPHHHEQPIIPDATSAVVLDTRS
jgi:hypothetical protein